ncbi:MAG: hypothetical protein Q4B18_04065 [Bacillota bacterium]|nr:hypothetical protein [Bacillota bacterium]
MFSEKIKKIFDNKVVRAIGFIIIAALLLMYLNRVFTIGNSDSNKQIFNGFYAEQEETIDVLYLGTSATNRYFIPPKAYNDAGIAGYNLATMGLPMLFVPDLIDEVEKTQSPQLYIIELRNVLKTKNEITDAHIRRVTDSMPASANKYEALDKALKYTEGATGELSNIDESPIDYLIPVVKYHSRLSAGEITPEDFLPWAVKNTTKGYVLSDLTLQQKPYKPPVYSDEHEELAPEMEAALLATLDRCDELDAEVMFVFSPYAMRKNVQAKFNTAIEIVEDRGYTVLDCNQPEVTDEIGIDWECDLYNSKHVNYVGAEKFTDYLVAYLEENYDLPDRRGDSKWDSWAEAYEEYLDFTKKGLNDPVE